MDPQSNNLSVVLKPPELQVAIPSGTGRLLSNAYLAGGRFIGKKVNRLAHKMGHGPDFITNQIVEQLGNTGERLLRLAELRVKPDRELEQNCLQLMKYALPTETIAAQLKAFKSIVILTTRFLGLRNVFLHCKHLQAAGTSKACIIKLWRGSEDVSSTELEWNFFLEFAASCVCDKDKVASLFENVALDLLGSVPVDGGEYSIIERLLVASESSENFESRMAVRYLGGILEFPSFWDQEFHTNHETVTNKLFERVGRLVGDLDVTSIPPTRAAPSKICADFDLQGTDLLAFALMRGVSFWDQQPQFYFSAPVLSNFKDLVQLLQDPGAEYLLPQSYRAASYKWNRFLSATFTCESVEILVTDTSSAEASDKGDDDKITAEPLSSPGTHIDLTNGSTGGPAVESESNKLTLTPSLPTNKQSPVRKFLDLILASSSKWPNWNPEFMIMPGDYGVVDRNTGAFEREGNIYDFEDFEFHENQKPEEVVAMDDTFIVTSLGVKSRSFTLEAEVNVPGINEASLKGQWEFGRKRDALLIMVYPSCIRVPPQVLLKHLIKFPQLKDKVLVTTVYRCPAYCLYLSEQENDVFSAALLEPNSESGEVGKAWWTQHSGGLLRDGCDARGDHVYTPLYILKQIRKRGLFRR